MRTLRLTSLLAAIALAATALAQGPRPNIVVVLADDLGIGDLGCYNPESKIPTPHLDRLASQGLRFTDAHTPSAVCTPTRYALLTGRYAWRSRLERGVLNGYSRLLLEPGRATIASVLKQNGYHTACIGKWHLGLGSYDPERPKRRADFSAPFDAGPHTVGFDEVFVIPASLDMPPYLYVDGDRVAEAPTAETPGSKRRWDGGGGFWRKGPMSPSFDFYRVLPNCTDRAVQWLTQRAMEDDAHPFFLYLPLAAPHTPWMPTEKFRGKSKAGHYGDFVTELDHSIGRVLKVLDDHGLSENTIVVVTSDNGSHWRPKDVATFDHRANLDYRGMKADVWEAGHRVPFLLRWPGQLDPGIADLPICLVDLFATLAAAAQGEIPADQAEDSLDFLPVLRGERSWFRTEIVHHAMDGMFAIRAGPWKFIDGLGSGGFTAPKRVKPGADGVDGQLYHLGEDPGETKNRFGDRPDLVAALRSLLQRRRQADGTDPDPAALPPALRRDRDK